MANYHGKFGKSKKPTRTRPFFWLGILCVIPAFIFSFYVGGFLAEAIGSRRNQQEAIQTYMIPAEVAKETISTAQAMPEEAPGEEETPAETTQETTAPTEPPRFPVIDFAGLKEKNEDVVAWLQIPAMEIINYPVVLGQDNAFYANHSWEGEENEGGAIFLDFRNKGDFSQVHNILYGHAMKDGTMFHDLGEWEKDSVYGSADRTVLLYLPGETRVYDIFAVERVNALDSRAYGTEFTAGEEWAKALEDTLFHSQKETDRELTEESEVLSLSTCVGGLTRLVVHAVCVEKVPV